MQGAECFQVAADGEVEHLSVLSTDRVDLLNVHKLLCCQRSGFARRASQSSLMSAPYTYFATESAGSGAAPLRRSPVRRAEAAE